ncbi:MAG: DNA-processing protein DprA [Flavobacteriales bacterium]|nr:DNA-processing protein DprA [Flavobacteriales bacterium]
MKNNGFFEISLSLVEGVGPIKAKNLIKHCGSAEAVFTEKRSVLLKIPEVGEKLVNAINNQLVFQRAEQELNFCDHEGIDILTYQNGNFPKRLLHCPDHPLVLFRKGVADLNPPKVISIVGTRRVTTQGKKVCEEIIEGLQESNVLIVSGLAFGVDICAHSAALNSNLETVGVLAHGLDRIYPREHSRIARQMMDQGALLTEFLSETNPDRENFPTRNRIVAGMSDATLVIESQKSGGAMITANLAFDYFRDVLAVPGRPDDVFSQGCNNLIRANKAGLVASADDLLQALNWKENKRKKPVQTQLLVDLSDEEEQIMNILKETEKISLDELGIKVNKTMSQLAVPLLNLELKGVVEALPGKVYRSV